MKRLVFALSLLATPALAQDASITLTLTPQEVVIVGNALGSRPYQEVVAIIAKLQQQIQQQQKPAEKEPQK